MGIHDTAAGALSASDSLVSFSIADQLDNLLAKPHLSRSWLFDAYPRDPDTSTDPVTTIRVSLSTDGHKRYPTDAEERQFIQAVVQPLAIGSSLGGRLAGIASVDQGEVIIGDAGGWHRTIANYDWFSRNASIYLGPRNGTQVQFAEVAKVITRGRRYDRENIAIMIDDFSFVFDRLLQTNYYAGTGGLNGSSNLTDKARPVLIGQVDQIEPVAVDGTNFIYQIHDGSLGALSSVDYVKDKMVALVFDADYADITTATPGVGEYSTSLAQGYIKLNAAPNGVITVGAKGLVSPTFGYVNTVASIIKSLAVDFAGLDQTVNLDLSAFTTLAAASTAIMGWYFREPGSRGKSIGVGASVLGDNTITISDDKGVTVRDAMEIFLRSTMTNATMLPNKIFTVSRITSPDAATADFTLAQDQIKLTPWDWSPYEVPVGRVIVGYRYYAKTLDAAAVDSTIGVEELEDIASNYRWSKAELTGNDAVQNNDFKTVVMETALYNSADAGTLATEQLGMRSKQRDIGRISAYAGLLKRRIGQVIQLTDDRLGSSPKKFAILGVRNIAAAVGEDDKVELELYG